jgi:hypothetical protein
MKKVDAVFEESEEFGDVKEPVAVDIPEPALVIEAPAIPEALVIFDGPMADMWLHESYARLTGVYTSLRFEPEGMPKNFLPFLLLLAGNAIIGAFKGGRGVLFVPKSLADNAVLSTLERGDAVGEYVSFYRK